MENSRKRHKTGASDLLAKYESLRSSLQENNIEAHKGEATQLVIESLEKLKQVYGIVQNENNTDTRVQLKDSEIFSDTSKFAATNAQNIRLGDSGVTINSDDFINKLKQYMNPYSGDQVTENENESSNNDESLFNSFNWLKLGSLYLQVSAKPILNGVLYGPLETERKKIGARSRIVDDTQLNSGTTTARNVQTADMEVNEEQNTAHMVKNVYRKFVEIQEKEDTESEDNADSEEGVNFFKFFINPKSFGQSVENLFFTSFLIKDGKLKLSMNDEGLPTLEGVDNDDDEDEEGDDDEEDHVHTTNHFIATFTYKAWQELVRKYNITECYLGHRPEPEDVFEEAD